MLIERKKDFNNISQRILYGYNFAFSDFEAVDSEQISKQTQQRLHVFMGEIINILYENPSLLDLPSASDESYEWYICNNQKPELNEIYLGTFKTLYKFYHFLHVTASLGCIENNIISIDKDILKENKAIFMPCFVKLLDKMGIQTDKNSVQISLQNINGKDLFNAMKMLAKLRYGFDFIRCSFNGSYDYFLRRIDDLYGYNGMLIELKDQCEQSGYIQSFHPGYGPTNFCFDINFSNGTGGFRFGYNPRKYQQFHFSTQNGIGVKAMLENFAILDNDVQKYLLDTCKHCIHCHGCTHGGRIKGGKDQNIVVKYNSDEISLCTLFPISSWETIDSNLINKLFKYHELQNVFNSAI